MIEHLARVVPASAAGTSAAGPDHPMRKVTRQIAFEPGGWTPERAAKVAAVFEELAPEWHTRAGEARLEVVTDAFARGGPIGTGAWLELGSGTGLVTPWLAGRAERVIAVDIAAGMLARAAAGAGFRVRADGAALPVADAALDALILVNAFLFPTEACRVVGPAGVIVWVNTSGDKTPIYLSAEDALLAMGDGWVGRASEAALGTWAVLRRRQA